MDLADTMFFFRGCNLNESLMRDSENTYINGLIKTIGVYRAGAIRGLSDYSFIVRDISHQLLLSVVKQIGASRFEENAQLFGYNEESFTPDGFSSKEKTIRFYLENKAAIMEWVTCIDFGRGGDASQSSIAEFLYLETSIESAGISKSKLAELVGTQDTSVDGFVEYANALTLRVLRSVCLSYLDFVDDYPYMAAVDTEDGYSSAF